MIFLFFLCSSSYAQHIITHKPYVTLPDNNKPKPAPQKAVIVAEVKTDTIKAIVPEEKKDTVIAEIPKPVKKNSHELITDCDFSSQADRVPQLPYITNYVDPAMVKKLKEKYPGKLYSITGLEAGNHQQNYKCRVCIKGKLQIEYVNEDGKVIDDPTPETFNN